MIRRVVEADDPRLAWRRYRHGPMVKITLIHWKAAEGRERARLLRLLCTTKAGKLVYEVILEYPHPPSILRNLRASPPAAVVIDLDRLPMQGRDLAVAIRTGKQTRQIPILFAGGDPAKVERVRQTLPDAGYTSWKGVAAALKRATAKPPVNPIAPSSNLAGYSGTPLPKKLGIKANYSLALLNEPDNFVEVLGELPAGVEFSRRLLPKTQLAIWFVRSLDELSSQIDSIAARVRSEQRQPCRLWIAWAKRTSPLAADVSESAVRAAGLGAGLVDYKVAAIDTDWSGLLFAPDGRRGRD